MKYIKRFEDIIDKYAEKRFGIESPFKYFDIKYQNYLATMKPVASVSDYSKTPTLIFKNPKTLNNFDSKVRAIGSISGDLYVAQKNKVFQHNDMAIALKLVDDNEDIEIYDLSDKYVVLYRIGDTNSFTIGESTSFLNINPRYKVVSDTIFDNLKKKNPQFKFFNEKVD